MSTLIVNGERSRPIPILSSVRQGFPLSMSLYILFLNPLLNSLEKKLAGIKIGPRGTRTSIIDYADDVTLIVTKPEEVYRIRWSRFNARWLVLGSSQLSYSSFFSLMLVR